MVMAVAAVAILAVAKAMEDVCVRICARICVGICVGIHISFIVVVALIGSSSGQHRSAAAAGHLLLHLRPGYDYGYDLVRVGSGQGQR